MVAHRAGRTHTKRDRARLATEECQPYTASGGRVCAARAQRSKWDGALRTLGVGLLNSLLSSQEFPSTVQVLHISQLDASTLYYPCTTCILLLVTAQLMA